MERWSGKTAVVTGASAGIGAALCVALADAGMKVVGLARRAHNVDELSSKVKGGGSIQSRQCDVSKVEEVGAAFAWIDQNMGGTHLLINNAGTMYPGHITEIGDKPLSDSELSSVIDVNIMAVIHCTRQAVASMKRQGFDGHIVNINSVAGHYIPLSPVFNIYPASKHAVTAFTAMLLQELAHFNSNTKITSISPGLVDTPMAESALPFIDFQPLSPKDVADAVLYVVSTPPNVNISELTIQPIKEKKL